MNATPLMKTSPLSAVYRRFETRYSEVAGWKVAEHCGNPEREKEGLRSGSVLVDWSHIGKISVAGEKAEEEAAKIDSRARGLKPLRAVGSGNTAVLRLAEDEFQILCLPGMEEALFHSLDSQSTVASNETGGLGCLVLAGPRRDEVLERSLAMNLRRDRLGPGSVVQTTVHGIHCTLLRTRDLEILLHSRDFSESLFEALTDVGEGVGLRPAGIGHLPVSFEIGE